MPKYPLQDGNGNKIGEISLDNDELCKALMDGVRYRLSCSFVDPPKEVMRSGKQEDTKDRRKFLSFRVGVEFVEPAALRRVKRRGITARVEE